MSLLKAHELLRYTSNSLLSCKGMMSLATENGDWPFSGYVKVLYKPMPGRANWDDTALCHECVSSQGIKYETRKYSYNQ